MSTVTFIAKEDEYLLAMNRDDLFARASALPIVRAQLVDQLAAYPQEQGGGTWIGVNQSGVTFAVLNWAFPPAVPKQVSRGTVIPRMLAATSHEHALALFTDVDLGGIYPFRLIGIFPEQLAVQEWRWTGENRSEQLLDWQTRHWFSSGASDEEADRIRGAITAKHWREENAGTRSWLRQLHASHEPEQGIFSICAHRAIGGTLSYTEIEVTRRGVVLAYSPAAPCKGVTFRDYTAMPRVVHPAVSA